MKDQEQANTNDSQKKNEAPFFARFLEGQHAETPAGAPNDEAVFQTLKYPSDRDEWDSTFSE
jgi:hypothetical protein